MALATDVPRDGFRLSMLIYDTRYRSYTIQIVVLILFAMAVAWLLNNTVQNLAVRGKEFNFTFLWQRAGYDIGQQLIPYTNDSSHFRAVLVGLINTLVVAFFGCIFATVLFPARSCARAIADKAEKGFVGPQRRLHLDWMEQRLVETPWFAGKRFTAADIQMSFPIQAAASRGDGLADKPALRGFLQRIEQRPGYQRAVARGGSLEALSGR